MAHGTAHRQTPNSTARSHTKIISCSRHTSKVGTPLPPRAASPPAPPQLDRERQEQSRAAHNSAYKRREAQRSPVQQAAPRDRALTPRPHSRLALTPRPRASPSPRALTPCPRDSPSRLRPRASALAPPPTLRQGHCANVTTQRHCTAPMSQRQGHCARAHAGSSARRTSNCSPSASRFTLATPASTSCEPSTTTNLAPAEARGWR